MSDFSAGAVRLFVGLSLLVLCATGIIHYVTKHGDSYSARDVGENCTRVMFDMDEAAYMACLAENALQKNWYPSPKAKDFTYQRWNGVQAFWENGLVVENLVNFMEYAGHRRYKSVVETSIRSLEQLLGAYLPFPSFDDMAWYGLSYLRVYEVLKNETFLTRAREIFNWTWQTAWDTSGNCSGGMWWDYRRSGKVSITNALMLQLGIKLYRITPGPKDPKLLHQVLQIWSFIEKNQIVDPGSHQVADGILANCSSNHWYGPTYTPGVLAVGLAHLSEAVKDPSLMTLGHEILLSTIQHHSSADGTLSEYCDHISTGCDADGKVFKGIFVRNVRYMAERSNQTKKASYFTFLWLNAKHLLKHSSCWDANKCKMVFGDGPSYYDKTVPVFGCNWDGPFNYSDPMQQMSALDLLVSSVKQGTTCTGVGCQYDPPLPP